MILRNLPRIGERVALTNQGRFAMQHGRRGPHMKTLASFLFALAFLPLTLSQPAHSDDTLNDDVTGELYTMRSVYRAEYAPAQWKKQYAQYDLEAQFQA